MWLVDLLKKRKARGFLLLPVLAGYGHRVSMSTSEHGVQKFGGCFLPQQPDGRPMGEEERDDYIYKYGPPGIREWVEECKRELGKAPKREDVVKSTLELELPDADAYPVIGLYTQRYPANVHCQEAAACYQLVMDVPLPSSVESDFHRPPEPRTVARIGTDLEKLWEVHVARQERSEEEFLELPCSAKQLANWKYEAATYAVRDLQLEW